MNCRFLYPAESAHYKKHLIMGWGFLLVFFLPFSFSNFILFFVVVVWGRGLSGGGFFWVFFHNFSPHKRTLSGISDKYISNDTVCTSAKEENAKIKGTAEN